MNSKKYIIKCNTFSVDNKEKWKLIDGEKELIVSSIIIDGNIFTDEDNTWCINCIGQCEIKDGIAYIKTTREDNVLYRHILKTVSYRFFGTLTTVFTAYLLGVSIELSSLLGIGELLIKPILYFFHERYWYKFGKLKK